jgi:hypothetical protein
VVELADELVELLDELLPDPVLDDDPVPVALILLEFELVTDEVVMEVPVELPETLDDDPLPVMEVEPVTEEEGEPELEEVCVAVSVGVKSKLMDVVELPETLDDDPLPLMEVESVIEEESEPELEEVCETVVGILPDTSKPQFFSTKG